MLLTLALCWFFDSTTDKTLGFYRKTLPDLAQDSYFQVRRRSRQDYCVSFILDSQNLCGLCVSVQVGPECWSDVHHHPPRRKPHQPSLQGRHSRTYL